MLKLILTIALGGKKKGSKQKLEWPQIVRAPSYVADETQILSLQINFKSRIKYSQRYNSRIILQIKIIKHRRRQAAMHKRAEKINCRSRNAKATIIRIITGIMFLLIKYHIKCYIKIVIKQ